MRMGAKVFLGAAALMVGLQVLGAVVGHGPVYGHRGVAEASAGLLVHHDAPQVTANQLRPRPAATAKAAHHLGILRHLVRVHRILYHPFRPWRWLPWWMRGN